MLDATMFDECPYVVGDIVKCRPDGSGRNKFDGYAKITQLCDAFVFVRTELWDLKYVPYGCIQKVV